MKNNILKLIAVCIIGVMTAIAFCACDMNLSFGDSTTSLSVESKNSNGQIKSENSKFDSQSSSKNDSSNNSIGSNSMNNSNLNNSQSQNLPESSNSSNVTSNSKNLSKSNSLDNSASNSKPNSTNTSKPATEGIIPITGEKFAVDLNFSGSNGSKVSGIPTYKTISSCLEAIASLKLSSSTNKLVYIAKGTYKEKILIPATLANVHFIGSSGETTSISYGDCSSTAGGTDASATVTVLGEGFSAYNIIFENSFDYEKSKLKDKQALAMLSKADKLKFYNCSFLGHQDTLEASIGRQYFKDCLVYGSVDFIFGNNAAVLFETCEIKSRYRSGGGGYITATKGNNGTNGQQVPKFGYVFMSCKLTSDSSVKSGSISLGRPWRADATVAYINCEMGAHISKAAYDGKSSGGKRYVYMNGGTRADGTTKIKNEPQNAHFVEFGNTGSGAITTAVKGCTMLTNTQALEYTAENIFATKNGSVTYIGNWNPTK